MVSMVSTDKGQNNNFNYRFTIKVYTFLLNLSTNLSTRLSISLNYSFYRIKSQMLKLSELNSYLHLQDEVTVFLSE